MEILISIGDRVEVEAGEVDQAVHEVPVHGDAQVVSLVIPADRAVDKVDVG